MNSLSYIPARNTTGKSSYGFLNTTAKPDGDVYPFGMQMPGRMYNSDDYTRGFNGMEKDDEIKGAGNSITFEYRMLDTRLGRWLSLDPLFEAYPQISPATSTKNPNKPVRYIGRTGTAGVWHAGQNIIDFGSVTLCSYLVKFP